MISKKQTTGKQDSTRIEYYDRRIDPSRLYLAQLKYFDEEHNGIEVNDIDAYAFLYEINGVYINPFDVFETLPVYKRVPYSNTTRDGEDFGSKIVLKQGESKDGPCYVIGFVEFKDLFGRDEIDEEVLKRFIITSGRFFVDRLSIMKSLGGGERVKYQDKILSDYDQLLKLQEYFDSHKQESKNKVN